MKEITSICCEKKQVIENLAEAASMAIACGHKSIRIDLELDLPDPQAANIWVWDISDPAALAVAKDEK
jgi:hypothetical protein